MTTKSHTKSYSNNDRLFFLLNPNEDIAENDPVRVVGAVVGAVVESLDLREFKKLYRERGRCPYHPKMMLKTILYAYMNNIYSCRRIERQVQRDIHYIRLAAQERPDFVTINRFRNRVKKEINNIFTQAVLLLAERGFITLDVEYIDGAKIESKANKYSFVWRKTVEKNRAKLQEKTRVLLGQIDDVTAQDKAAEAESVEFTPDAPDSLVGDLKDALDSKTGQKRGNTPHSGLFLIISRFNRPRIEYFGKIPKKLSPEKDPNLIAQKIRGCAVNLYYDTDSCPLFAPSALRERRRCQRSRLLHRPFASGISGGEDG